MAGLHSAGAGLLAGSGGSGCATAWHLYCPLQPKAGAVPCWLAVAGLHWLMAVVKPPGPSKRAALYEGPSIPSMARGALRQSCDEG